MEGRNAEYYVPSLFFFEKAGWTLSVKKVRAEKTRKHPPPSHADKKTWIRPCKAHVHCSHVLIYYLPL